MSSLRWLRHAALRLITPCFLSVVTAPLGYGAEPLEFVLDGVIVAANPAHSVALIRRADAPRAHAVRVGQEVSGYVLVEVSRDSARFQSAGGELRLFLPAAGGSPEPPPDVEPLRPGADGVAGDGWSRRAFSRAEARARLSKEIPVILSETDLTTRIEDGEARGVAVNRFPEGTILSEAGLLPGDVLVSINDEPLRSVDSLFELLSRLLNEEEIRVLVRRRGEVLKLAYAFTN
jgi:type II secretion system protein C